MIKHHVILFGENSIIIGEAANEAEARAYFSEVWNVDFYDAEDGPKICNYEADGCGCFIIDGERN
jgi:hypothetical protein